MFLSKLRHENIESIFTAVKECEKGQILNNDLYPYLMKSLDLEKRDLCKYHLFFQLEIGLLNEWMNEMNAFFFNNWI